LTTRLLEANKIEDITTPYYMFKYSIRSEITRKYYERRIKKFFDFIAFSERSQLEKRCNLFAQKGKDDAKWAMTAVVRFLQFQKERVERGEITAATLSNFVKSLKLFLEMCEIQITWKSITLGFIKFIPLN
jgi:hypothetical protein